MRVPKLSHLSPPVPSAGFVGTEGYVGSGLADTTMIRLMPLINLAVVVWAWFTVTPLGFSGTGLYGLILMVLGTCGMSLRLLDPATLAVRTRFVATLAAGTVAGLLFGFDPTSAATAFAPIIAGTAGFRFSTVPAIMIATVTSGTAFVATAIRFDGTSYYPLLVGLAVLIGMTRRDRSEAMRLAREKVEQTDRAVASESRAQVLAERARVAREIHDVLAHSLSGVNMQLNLADALLEDGRADDGRQAVKTAQGMVADGLVEARRAVYALREESRGLVASIGALVTGPDETLSTRGDQWEPAPEATAHLVRIVGEAITNARRHAAGAPITVDLQFTSDRLRVSVVNGRAMRTEHFTGGSGMGLIGMRERAAEIGGELSVGPGHDGDPDTGWTMTIEVPR
ncbi:sensor histidine kinase [Williamsia deligens]|uniref:histidine kinase n=1 Tax=Williamsia deligens TaxID=321325 RepID=A0ABW3G5I7_9NOCA|nr:sensor histidine kinase [Williamsia deligens]MCP2193881.1 Signal transduction histidine kinase [Williamsia deligens]